MNAGTTMNVQASDRSRWARIVTTSAMPDDSAQIAATRVVAGASGTGAVASAVGAWYPSSLVSGGRSGPGLSRLPVRVYGMDSGAARTPQEVGHA